MNYIHIYIYDGTSLGQEINELNNLMLLVVVNATISAKINLTYVLNTCF